MPITGVDDSDGDDSTAARDGSDEESTAVKAQLQDLDRSSPSSGENISKITASETTTTGPKTVVVSEQAGQDAVQAEGAEAA